MNDKVIKFIKGMVALPIAFTFAGQIMSAASSFMLSMGPSLYSITPLATPANLVYATYGLGFASVAITLYSINRFFKKNQNPNVDKNNKPAINKDLVKERLENQSQQSNEIKRENQVKTSIAQDKTTPIQPNEVYIKQENSQPLMGNGFLVISNKMPCERPEQIKPADLKIVHQSDVSKEQLSQLVYSGNWPIVAYYVGAPQAERKKMRKEWADRPVDEKSPSRKRSPQMDTPASNVTVQLNTVEDLFATKPKREGEVFIDLRDESKKTSSKGIEF